MKRALAALLALALVITLEAPAARVAAAGAQEIPGVELTSRTVSGLVGGPVVDEVYEILIPAGTLFVATLRGEPGAELGLYLFEPGSTSIQTDAPLAQSAKPGSNQVISTGVELGGRFYLNVNGRNTNRAYEYDLSISITRDSTPPTIVEFTPQRSAQSQRVCTTLKATDLVSGVRLLQLRDLTDEEEPTWIRYAGRGEYCISVRPGNGERTLQVVARNGVGLRSAPRQWTVRIDDTQPSAISFRPAQSSVVFEPRPTIAWTFSERIRPAGVGSAEVFAYNQLGARLSGVTTLSADQLTLRWTPIANVPAGSTLLLGLSGVQDLAGNAATPVDSIQVFRKKTATISLRATAVRVQRVRLAYSVSPALVGRELAAEIFVNDLWQSWRSVTPTATTGAFNIERGLGSAVRLRWIGDDEVAGAKSGRVAIPQ
jgi:hypothetical protein